MTTSSRIVLPVFCLILLSFLAACSGILVHGTIAGQTIESRVDSEIARYYVTNYLAGKHNDSTLDARIDQAYKQTNGSIPSRAELKDLSDEFSSDFAALFFADEISRVPVNRQFRAIFQANYAYTRDTFSHKGFRLPPNAKEYDLLIVPTFLYTRADTGADMAAPRKALSQAGFHCYFVKTVDDGPIESNAEIIMAAIRAHAASERRLIIISASKSGPEVALALTRLGEAESGGVAAWINAVGALQGTPLIDDDALPAIEFFVGKVDKAGVESMSAKRSRKRFETFRVPKHVLVLNYFGIPLTSTVSFRARWGFYPMKKYGPNDGMVLLADMIYPGGITLTELGSDHFMMDRHLDIVSVALTTSIIRWLENDVPPDHIATDVK